MITYNDYYLAHHGVPGQKWGVRNAEWYPIAEWKASRDLNTRDRDISRAKDTLKYGEKRQRALEKKRIKLKAKALRTQKGVLSKDKKLLKSDDSKKGKLEDKKIKLNKKSIALNEKIVKLDKKILNMSIANANTKKTIDKLERENNNLVKALEKQGYSVDTSKTIRVLNAKEAAIFGAIWGAATANPVNGVLTAAINVRVGEGTRYKVRR